jgi:bifunctional DNA-binding transcriptional regulator/antitoxin component of YhaV-PrlF toxin-antitoxin module
MKEHVVMTVSRVGQSTFPRGWRRRAGLAAGGLMEVRFLQDGKNSLLLTPRKPRRTGAVGLLAAMRACPGDLPRVVRHALPSR